MMGVAVMSFGVTSSQCQVLVMGAPLNPLVSGSLVSVEVDSTMFVPVPVQAGVQGQSRTRCCCPAASSW